MDHFTIAQFIEQHDAAVVIALFVAFFAIPIFSR